MKKKELFYNKVRIWNVESGDCIKILEGHTNGVLGVSFSPNNQYVVSGSNDTTVRIWDVESGDCIKTYIYVFILLLHNH